MTIREAAARLGLSPSTVRRRIAEGQLGCHRDGARIVITEGHVRAYLARIETKARLRERPETDWGHIRDLFPGLFNAKPVAPAREEVEVR